VGRRSPILGYNHNVRYRGVVFHVQTEDSGLINPHLFTHLFHGGVIVSTRKLVYDPDADDGVVKSLMQAQHKAVMKELKRGLFDDKIDQYLGGIPELVPRGGADPDASQPIVVRTTAEEAAALEAIVDPGSSPVIELTAEPEETDDLSIIEIDADAPDGDASQPEIQISRLPSSDVLHARVAGHITSDATIPNVTGRGGDSVPPLPPTPRPTQQRVTTPPERRAAASAALPPIPPRARPDSGGGTVPFGSRSVAAAGSKQSMTPPPVVTRAATPPPVPNDPRARKSSPPFEVSASAVDDTDAIEVHSPAPGSAPALPSQTQPSRPAGEYSARASEGLQQRDLVPKATSRMAAIRTPPTGVPETGAARDPRESKSNRSAQKPQTSTGVPEAMTDRGTGATATTRQPTASSSSRPAAKSNPQLRSNQTGQRDVINPEQQRRPPSSPPETRPAAIVQPKPRSTPPDNQVPQPSAADGRTRTPTAPRLGVPAAAAAAGGARKSEQRSSGGVVMSRPAVIVGGPRTPRAEPPTPQPQGTAGRVRKAREEGGRGVFGQDLISEKSLDEVILAYLSEDAGEDT
jgi:hypothetical protein